MERRYATDIQSTAHYFNKPRRQTKINPLGEPFDPNLHEAIGMVDTDKQSEDNKGPSMSFRKGIHCTTN